jgi:hypothetical protein
MRHIADPTELHDLDQQLALSLQLLSETVLETTYTIEAPPRNWTPSQQRLLKPSFPHTAWPIC